MDERTLALTCHTDGCMNADIPITVTTTTEGFVCGACGYEIADAQLIK